MNKYLPRLSTLMMLSLAAAAGSGCSGPDRQESADLLPTGPPALEPAQAPASFQCQDGFQMDLLAAEPLVYDPVALAYDENGRAFVAEMSDYPYSDRNTHVAWSDLDNQEPLGRIRILEDSDGDGRFDRSTLFAEDLSWPTGLAFWKGGVFVAATPDLWYLKDSDGDGKADVRERLYTGFRKYNVQAVINNLIWGLDHRIYGAGGTNGGRITRPGRPDLPAVELGRGDFAIDPLTQDFLLQSGGTRFGNTFDDWGNRFICNIRNPVQHVVLPSAYLARNPHLTVSRAIHDAAEAGDQLQVYRLSPAEPWRDLRARVWAADPAQATSPRSELSGAGFWTSSAGLTIYRGAAYPDRYYGNVFIGEVAGNLIHRQILEPDGVTFRSRRADEGVEFVASRDNWFRAVNFVNAPDGTLHVVDMYREVIEHPWSIPDDIHAQLNLLNGTDRGRIYRLSPPGFQVPSPPRLGSASTLELVQALENPNAWWRETAHRLIFERQDAGAVAPLRRLLQESPQPLARLHSLWSLHGLKSISAGDLKRALRDPNPGVRENALRVSELYLEDMPELAGALLPLADDPGIRVRFQAAFTLGYLDSSAALPALARIARRDTQDAFMRSAVLSSASGSSPALLTSLLADRSFHRNAGASVWVRELASLIGARGDQQEISRILAAAQGSGERILQWSLLVGLGDGLRRSDGGLSQLAAEAGRSQGWMSQALERAAAEALDDRLPVEQRNLAIELLGHHSPSRAVDVLKGLLDPRRPPEIQLQAVSTLKGLSDPRIGPLLLEPWRSYSPGVRREVVEAMTAQPERIGVLLEAVEGGRIPAVQISAVSRARLLNHTQPEIASRAQALFGSLGSSDRAQVIEKYRQALALPADAQRGRLVFEQNCMSCHRLDGAGNDVGPNLSTIRHKSPEEMLTQIFDPNREVSSEFVVYDIELVTGDTVSGVISDETATAVTVKRAGDVRQTIPRSSIAKLTSSGLSLMPEDLETALSAQDTADLLHYLLAP